MREVPVFINLQTIAVVGGENSRSAACIFPFPKGCTRIYIGSEKLDLVGQLLDGSLGETTLAGEIYANLKLRPEILRRVGRPAILFTREGEVFCNNGWLESREFVYPIPAAKRRFLRWFGTLPNTFCENHPDFLSAKKVPFFKLSH